MAVLGVEIDEIDEREAAVRQVAHCRDQRVEMAHVVGAFDFDAGGAMAENVADLADADDGPPRLRGDVEQVAHGRGNGEILAARRARVKPAFASPRKGGR